MTQVKWKDETVMVGLCIGNDSKFLSSGHVVDLRFWQVLLELLAGPALFPARARPERVHDGAQGFEKPALAAQLDDRISPRRAAARITRTKNASSGGKCKAT